MSDGAPLELWRIDFVLCREALTAAEAMTPRLPLATDLVEGSDRRLAHIALRIVIERFLGAGARRVPFAVASGGRPELPMADLSFSLSHTRGVALLAVGRRGPLGIDIELPRAVRIAGRRRLAIQRAGAALGSDLAACVTDDDAAFLRAWTRLEALAKADGCGMGRMLGRLGAWGGPVLSDPELATRAADALGALRIHDLALGEDGFGSLAAPRDVACPPVRSLPASADGLAALLA